MLRIEESFRKLRENLQRMTDIVREMLDIIEKAIVKEDFSKLDQIFDKDALLDELEIEMDNNAVQLLALINPVATDLRFVFSVIKLNVDLERIGDECKNAAKELRSVEKPLPEEIKTLARKVPEMVFAGFQALINQDAALARKIILMDDEIDKLEYEIIQKYSSSIGLAFAAKALERIADHTTNIAENVVYVTEGVDIRHENTIMKRLNKKE